MGTNKYTITLNGTKYPITAEEPEEYIRKIEFYLNSRIKKSNDKSVMIYSDSITLALLSIDLADTLFRTQQQFNELKAETTALMDRFDALSAQYDKNVANAKELEQQIQDLKEKLLILKLGGSIE